MINKRLNFRFTICTTLLLILASSCATKREPDFSELLPLFNQLNLNHSEPQERHKRVTEIEQLDSGLYGPFAAKIIYLESQTPISEGAKPRYWLLVEDYDTVEKANKRASEYSTVGTYDRILAAYKAENGYMEGGSLALSKISVRIWAVARGRRVYALTTDAYLFTFIETQKSLRTALETLGEK